MGDRRRTRFARFWVLGVVGLTLAACGAEPSTVQPSTAVPSTVSVADPTETETAADFTAAAGAAPALQAQQELDQPAIWPAPDVVFTTPEEAAADFVSAVLISEGDPTLGEFQQGDARSGEIAVLFAGETGDLDPPLERGVLLLRQIGPTDGWYVIAATSDGAVIDTPSALDEVEAGTVTVAGEGRGQEGTLNVWAFPPGDADAAFDRELGAGGASAENEPYSVELDLSGADDGEVVVILVRGDAGLGNDPGTFAAIPIVIESAPSPTIPPVK